MVRHPDQRVYNAKIRRIEMTMPFITAREYDPEDGSLLENASALYFGKITKGAHTRVKVIDLAFSGATSIGNIKLGLVASAGLDVNLTTGTIYSDGSSSTGNFGIMSSQDFDASIASQPLTRHFAGLNADATSTNDYNVSVGARSTNVSDYIYLDVEVSSAQSGSANGAYKVFFDFT